MEAKGYVERCIPRGPWGYANGTKWMFLPVGFITKITVWHGSVVSSINFQTYGSSCSVGDSENLISGGYNKDEICIDSPHEYLVSICGSFGYHDKYGYGLNSICFKTNENSYGPFGSDSGTAFSYDGKEGVVVGFHGRSFKRYSAELDTDMKRLAEIGVYVKPKSLQTSACPFKSIYQSCSSMPGMVMPRDAGPWGAAGGNKWDDGVFSAVQQVRVYAGWVNSVDVIYALQFEYLKRDGASVMSELHGQTCGTEMELVHLDVEDEYLIGISGHYGPVEGYNGREAITSISFHTNQRTHGPFGKESGAGHVYFQSCACRGKVVGFHGSNNGFTSAVGVHMEYF